MEESKEGGGEMNQPKGKDEERIVIKKYYGVCPKCGTDIEMDVQRTMCPFCGAIVDLPFRHDSE